MSSGAWEVRVQSGFWEGLRRLRGRYTKPELVEIVAAIKECMAELAETGTVRLSGWSDHELRRPPYADGMHFEFHVHDDDVLVVYFRRERRRVIRMVGIYDHDSIPG